MSFCPQHERGALHAFYGGTKSQVKKIQIYDVCVRNREQRKQHTRNRTVHSKLPVPFSEEKRHSHLEAIWFN